MSKKANPGLIGLFVVGAVALMAGVLLLFGSSGWFKQPAQFATYFEGSVVGLQKGSAVLFRGVPVGVVADVFASVDSETQKLNVIVVLEIDRTAVKDPSGLSRRQPIEKVVESLVTRGMRTKLIVQSLVAGQLAINLDFYPDTPAVYRAPPDYDYPEIPSVPSDFQQVQEVVSGLISRLENLKLEELLVTATRTLETIDQLANSEKVASILEGVDTLVNSDDTQQLTADLRSTVGKLDTTLEDARNLLAHVDAQVEPVMAKLDPIIDQLGQTLTEAHKALEDTQALTGEDSELVYRTNAALGEMESAMRSLRVLLDFLDQHPEALLRGRPKR